MKKYSLLVTLLTFILVSCSKDDPGMSLQVENPATYSFKRNGLSTVSYPGQTTRINMGEELIRKMTDFSATAEQLLEMYTNQTASGGDANPFSTPELNAATKSIRSKVAASKDFFSANTVESAAIKADFENWINAQLEEVFPNQNVLAAPGVAGQIADGSSVRYISGKGLEYDQAVNKSLIGALMLDQIVNNYLSPAVLDDGDNRLLNDNGTPEDGQAYTTMEHKWDEAYGYLFGGAPDSADPLATLGSDDSFLNKYLGRVENDIDFAGTAQSVFDAFKLGRAAIVAGDYELRDEQSKIIREELSRLIAIRAVYYLQQGKNGLPLNGDQAAYGSAFHDLSEGFGFIYSLRFTRIPNGPDSYFTKEEVDTFLAELTAGAGFWEVTPETLDSISEAIASKFDFTVAQAAE